MLHGILRYTPRNKSNLHDICICQNRLCRPLCNLECIILQLGTDHGSTLGIKLIPPIHHSSRLDISLGIPLGGIKVFIQCKSSHVLIHHFGRIRFILLDDTMKFGTAYNLYIPTKIKPPVSISNRSRFHPRSRSIILIEKGIGKIEILSLIRSLGKNLLRKVLVHHGSFKRKSLGSINSFRIIIGFSSRWLGVCCFIDGKVVELGFVTFVEKECAVGEFLDDNVPWVCRT
mmetsp:Transcript_16125/g.24091  ORF Transcript_16125/g.24091 Transcript_16125/m.24091 type:complete len:230 (-) Transcript_16125:963-1652(-)